MTNFKEHNNREISNKLAEYITGVELRKYVAEKVKKYIKIDNPTVFDGAVGSGQLEQFVSPSVLYGVDIQELSVNSARENFKNSELEVKSFFEYENENLKVDCVIMNPPFSIKFKDLSEKERENIQEKFNWKKSGVVDDIFVLKSLKFTKRYGFYILFPGVAYRKTEEQFRKLIGNNLTELNIIENAFDDTSISVIFIVIDKEKETNEVSREIYNCKIKKLIANDIWSLDDSYRWEQLKVFEKKEEINIDEVNTQILEITLKKIDSYLQHQLFMVQMLEAKIDYLWFVSEIEKICKKYRKKFVNNEKTDLTFEVFLEQLKLKI